MFCLLLQRRSGAGKQAAVTSCCGLTSSKKHCRTGRPALGALNHLLLVPTQHDSRSHLLLVQTQHASSPGTGGRAHYTTENRLIVAFVAASSCISAICTLQDPSEWKGGTASHRLPAPHSLCAGNTFHMTLTYRRPFCVCRQGCRPWDEPTGGCRSGCSHQAAAG